MGIILVIGIPGVWIGSIYVRRHYDRKRDAKRANLAATDAPYDPSTPGTTPAMRQTLGMGNGNANANGDTARAAMLPPVVAVPDMASPSSPTVASPPLGMRNRDAMRSEPHFTDHDALTVARPHHTAHGEPGYSSWAPAAATGDVNRPRSTLGEPIRDVKRRTLTSVKSDASIQAQSAEFLEASPAKLQKAQK